MSDFKSKSLHEHPVNRLYSISHNQFSNRENLIRIVEYKVSFTAKQIRLKKSEQVWKEYSIFKREEPFFYDLKWYNSYFSTPENAVLRFEEAVNKTLESKDRSENRKEKIKRDLIRVKEDLEKIKKWEYEFKYY